MEELDFGKDSPIRKLKANGYIIENEKILTVKEREVCLSLIEPIGIYENVINGKEVICLGYKKDNKWKQILIPQEKIANANKLIELAGYGIPVSSMSTSVLSKYLIDLVAFNRDMLPRGKSISKMGWYDEKFIPYDTDVIYDGEECFKAAFESLKEKGSFDLWKDWMSVVRNNIVVRLLMGASVASVLLKLLNKKPFVTLVWGTTGDGKTVAAMCAMSIWGNPTEGHLQFSMNNTDNYYYRTAEFMNNLPCFFDELQTYRGDLDRLIMGLTEGMDRGKAKADGGVETLKKWQNTFILTGEQTASTINSGGGTLNRLIEINTSGKIISDGFRVVSVIANNYGFAGKKIINYIKENGLFISTVYKNNLDALIENSNTEEKQAQNMALIKTADDLLRICIFNEEKELDIEELSQFMFTKEEINVSERAWEFISNEFANNIKNFTGEGRENWGKCELDDVYVNKNVLEKILLNNRFSPQKMFREWSKNGRLIKDTGKGYSIHASVRGAKGHYIHLKMELEDNEIGGKSEGSNRIF